jgi:uncharacterized membrane protein
MSSNRQNERDREQFNKDLRLDEESNETIKSIHVLLTKIDEDIKLDRQAIQDHSKMLVELSSMRDDIKKLLDESLK